MSGPPATGCVPTVQDVAWLLVEDQAAAGVARRTATALAQRLGFGERRTAEVAIVAAELATNLVRHAERGQVLIRSRPDAAPVIEFVAIDGGPGMADPDYWWHDGRSTTGTLGIGLGAVARLSDEVDVVSEAGRGTVIAARLGAEPGQLPSGPAVAAVTKPIEGETACGDSYAVREDGAVLSLMVCDGSGHGPLAAVASQRALRLFCEQPPSPPETTVRRMHQELVGTRGAAVSVAQLDRAAGTLRFAGVGNVAGHVVVDGVRRSMVSLPGVAGYQARTFRAFDYEAPPNALVILHSDGLTDKWDLAGRPDLRAGSPLAIAAALVRDAGTRRDDACALVARVEPT